MFSSAITVGMVLVSLLVKAVVEVEAKIAYPLHKGSVAVKLIVGVASFVVILIAFPITSGKLFVPSIRGSESSHEKKTLSPAAFVDSCGRLNSVSGVNPNEPVNVSTLSNRIDFQTLSEFE